MKEVAIVVGLGSMGRRRIQILKSLTPTIKIVGVDNNIHRAQKISEELFIETKSSLKESIYLFQPKIAFVCVSPPSHCEIIEELLNNHIHVFSEINIVNKCHERLIQHANNNSLILFLSSTMLYRSEMEFLKSMVNSSKISNYSYQIGQFLPDWHPWEDYKSFFAANKETNAIREILAIELPWIIDLFGKIEYIEVASSDSKELELDYPDYVSLFIRHFNKSLGVLIIDIRSMKPIRSLILHNDDKTFTWNGKPDGLEMMNQNKSSLKPFDEKPRKSLKSNYADFINEDAYIREVQVFLNMINGDINEAVYTFENDKEVLEIIDTIEAKYL